MLPELPVLVPVQRTVTVLPAIAMPLVNVPPKWLMVRLVLLLLSNWPLTVLLQCVPAVTVLMVSAVIQLVPVQKPVLAVM